MSDPVLYLERPSFWSEARDPACWHRGLKVLDMLESEEGAIRGTARSLWQGRLKQVLSRRSLLGLFGLAPDHEEKLLLGAGLLEYHPSKNGWTIADFARPLLAADLEEREALKRLGMALLRRSPWIRLLVLRLMQGDWALAGWRHLRQGGGNLKAGVSLILRRFAEDGDWFSGIEPLCAQAWFAEARPAAAIRLHPNVLSREARRDDFSWAPFKAPLYLFDYLGWLRDDGDLRIPADVMKTTGLAAGHPEPIPASALLRDITEREADLRGFVAVERALRQLHAKLHPGRTAHCEEFAVWMDALMACALEKGAIEILAAEPGQARHGRGLFGDRQRKLAKWVVHEDFNDCLAELERRIIKGGMQGMTIKGSGEIMP